MKKMMVIAVMMSAMLMPAQMMAKENKNNAKAKIENRIGDRMEFKANRKEKKFMKAKPNKPNNKKFMKKRPMRRPAPVIVNRPPAPRPRRIPAPAPQYIYVNNYNNDVVEAAATIVGIAALASIIAD